MVIEDGKFYFTKDEFFDVFKDYGLMVKKMEKWDHVTFALKIGKIKK